MGDVDESDVRNALAAIEREVRVISGVA
jgi:hypothetical protein